MSLAEAEKDLAKLAISTDFERCLAAALRIILCLINGWVVRHELPLYEMGCEISHFRPFARGSMSAVGRELSPALQHRHGPAKCAAAQQARTGIDPLLPVETPLGLLTQYRLR